MVIVVNVHEAKSQLSRLIARAEAGEEVVIARAGTPAVRLAPINPAPRARRQPGLLRGLHIPDEVFDPLTPQELKDWE